MSSPLDAGAQAGMYGGAAGATYFGIFSVNEWAAIAGAVIAGLGFLVHLWFTLQRNRRAEEAHRAEMEAIRSGATRHVPDRAASDAEDPS